MEEELLKRFTDCVYFLASPLTCKKGFDCEYRHSEMARLNPRDCWYWLSGSCFNPTCGFRHPPLDVHAEVSSESATLTYQCSAAANKTNLPCYFYNSGFCNKGDRCSYLHGPDDSAITGNSLKTGSLPLDRKTSIENDVGAAQTETHPNPSKTAPNSGKDSSVPLKVDLQPSAPKTVIKKSASPKTSVFKLGRADCVRSESLLLKEGITQTRSPSCTEESSEEQSDDDMEPEEPEEKWESSPSDDHVEPEEPEEKWESSPGFDVLVDNKSEDLDYENDSEYPLAPEGEEREHFFSYDHEDSIQHETRYPNVEFSYDRDVYGAYEGSDNVRNRSAHPRDRRLDSIFFQRKRRLFNADLRDYLSKGRVVKGNPLTPLSRSEYSHLISRSLERPQRRSMGRSSSGRLASKVGKHSIESTEGQGGFRNRTNRRGWLKRLESNRSISRPYREKRLSRGNSVSSEVSRNPISRERRSKDVYKGFTGPKTLAQIREEKMKTEENSGKTRHSFRAPSSDFQGPKPLSEILKEKERLAKNGQFS